MKVLLFAGTTEARELASRLVPFPVEVDISVATPYGGEPLRAFCERFRILSGRLDKNAMTDLIQENAYALVVDATHPYAVEASKTIRQACSQTGARLMRLSRPPSDTRGFIHAESASEAAVLLTQTTGNILLTTGSKDLPTYAAAPGLTSRAYVRVLPCVEALAQCSELGFPPDRVIAMQGPFSKDLNLALLRQFDIRIMVTKDGGSAGGFPEKIEAARESGVQVLVVGRPTEETGDDMETIVSAIRSMLEDKP